MGAWGGGGGEKGRKKGKEITKGEGKEKRNGSQGRGGGKGRKQGRLLGHAKIRNKLITWDSESSVDTIYSTYTVLRQATNL